MNSNKIPLPLLLLFAILCASVFWMGGTAYLSPEKQMIFAWLIVGFLIVGQRLFSFNASLLRLILMVLTLFLGVRYCVFRFTQTLSYTSFIEFFFVVLLFVTELYALTIQLLGMFVMANPIDRPLQPIDLDDPNLPTVDVLIPTYNETEQMVAITAGAATLMNYPKEKLNIYILDDGGTVQKRTDPDPQKAAAAKQRHETLKVLAEFLEVEYRTREKNISAKAGNINQALYGDDDDQPRPNGELVLILDCDHVPTRDLLENTVSHFQKDEKLFLVQTPHFFINPDPIERNLGTFKNIPGENEVFFGAVHLGLDFWNTSYFCGSAAVLKRRYLDEAGGVLGETITEDAETALFLHGKGYNSVYVNRPMVCGLSPETFDDFIVQRNRWAQGMIQIMLLKNPLTMKGLSVVQKICYCNLTIYWFFGLARCMFFIAPFLYIFFGLQIYQASLFQCLAYPIPYVAASMILTNYVFGSVRHPFFSELYEMAQSLYNIPAFFSVLLRPRAPKFKVTPKDKSLTADFLSPIAYPFYFLLVLSVAMYPVALVRLLMNPLAWNGVVICLVWGSFNFLLLMLCLGIVWERKQLRKKHRIPLEEAVTVKQKSAGGEEQIHAHTADISEEGIGLVLPPSVVLQPGERIAIDAEDSTGKKYTLAAEVLRTSQRENEMYVGCQFIYDDELTFLYLTSYIYGDSQRWADFLQKRRANKVSLGQGLVEVLSLGLKGTYHHFKGLSKLAVPGLKKQYMTGGVWNRLRSVFQARP
ncbi:MAG: UDP-forming cellulose synthase catalytic subunit [Desulfobulbaceae bacterium]|nr:UDP-forming cellulose synthase catalytic subunit [Desulfobulbaceae bacterium]